MSAMTSDTPDLESPAPGPQNAAEPARTPDLGPGTLDSGPGTLDPELDVLRKKAGERDEFLALAQRVQADFINYQKRMEERDRAERKYALAELFRDLLPAVDALDACASMAAKGGDAKAHVDGFLIAQKELVRLLEKNGLKPLAAEGEFDPAKHEAVGFFETADRPENQVGEVMRKGYRLHERILRPAQVRVTRRPPPPADAAKE